MKIKKIKFSLEWDKLKEDRKKLGEFFTTGRGYTPSKEIYYREMEEEIVEIELKGKVIGKAKVIGTDIERCDDLTMFWWKMDTHKEYGREDVHDLMKKFYRNPDPILIVIYMQWVEV